MLLLKTLILGHSRNICDLSIFSKYHIKRSEDNLNLLKILKDADMLDAFRLAYFKINITKLNLDMTKYLIELAKYVNKIWIEKGVDYGLSKYIKRDK